MCNSKTTILPPTLSLFPFLSRSRSLSHSLSLTHSLHSPGCQVMNFFAVITIVIVVVVVVIVIVVAVVAVVVAAILHFIVEPSNPAINHSGARFPGIFRRCRFRTRRRNHPENIRARKIIPTEGFC